MRPRRRFRSRKARGIAEIVGTLMLILIVVAASIALAAFIASYQKQLQAEEAQAQQRSLESLKILSITPVLSTSIAGQWSSFSFVLASEYINPSGIESITVNGQPIHYYWVQNLSAPSQTPTVHDTTNTSDALVLAPHEEVIVSVNLTGSIGTIPQYSMFDPSFVLTTTDYVELSVYTALQNTFTQVFLPPTAVGIISTLSTFSDGTYIDEPVLDGSNSFAAVNDTVVEWSWNVTNTTSMVSISTAGGTGGTPNTWSVVDGSTSVTGSATFNEPYGFVAGTSLDLTVGYSATSGTGTGQISPGSLTFSESSTPPTLAVSFGFTYEATAAGTITIENDGAALNYSTTHYYGAVSATATVNPTSAVIGANVETGQVTFTEPVQYNGITALSLTFAGGSAAGTVTSGPSIIGVVVTGGMVTVSFSFTYTATAAGTLGTATATGVYTELYGYSATGEKVVPSYWESALAGTVFTVILTVQSSDALYGTAQTSYTVP